MPKKKLFECYFVEYNGERENGNNHLVYAVDHAEASKIMTEYLTDYYGECESTPEEIADGCFSFDCGCIALRLKNITETTKKNFMKSQFEAALIN